MKYFSALIFIFSFIGAHAQLSNGSVKIISDLKSIGGTLADKTTVIVQGYNTVNDGGGGTFVWDVTNDTDEDNGCIFKQNGNAGSGRWIRVLDDEFIRPEYFGAYGNGSNNDDTPIANAIQKCENLSDSPINHKHILFSKFYRLTSPITFSGKFNIVGFGSFLYDSSTSTESFITIGRPPLSSYDTTYDVSSITVEIGKVILQTYATTNQACGVELINIISSNIRIKNIEYFNTGLKFTSFSNRQKEVCGCFNDILLPMVYMATVNVEIETKVFSGSSGTNSAHFNQNIFRGGDFGSSRSNAFGILMHNEDNLGGINNNTFIGTSFEMGTLTTNTPIRISTAQVIWNHWIDVRNENNKGDYFLDISPIGSSEDLNTVAENIIEVLYESKESNIPKLVNDHSVSKTNTYRSPSDKIQQNLYPMVSLSNLKGYSTPKGYQIPGLKYFYTYSLTSGATPTSDKLLDYFPTSTFDVSSGKLHLAGEVYGTHRLIIPMSTSNVTNLLIKADMLGGDGSILLLCFENGSALNSSSLGLNTSSARLRYGGSGIGSPLSITQINGLDYVSLPNVASNKLSEYLMWIDTTYIDEIWFSIGGDNNAIYKKLEIYTGDINSRTSAQSNLINYNDDKNYGQKNGKFVEIQPQYNAPIYKYEFNTGTSVSGNSMPFGQVRLNNSSPSSGNKVFLSKRTTDYKNIASLFDDLPDGSYLYIQLYNSVDTFYLLKINPTNVIDNGDYLEINYVNTSINSGGIFYTGDKVAVGIYHRNTNIMTLIVKSDLNKISEFAVNRKPNADLLKDLNDNY